MDLKALLEAHTPNLTDENDAVIRASMFDDEADLADLAVRTCSCGRLITGYYDYQAHLLAVTENG